MVSAAKSFAAIAGTAAFTVNPLANVTDMDSLDVLKLVAGPLADGVHTTLIPGGYYQPDIQITQFFPNDPAFRSLAQGEVGTVTWNYDITDGHSVVHDTMIFTVTGVNDAPVITSPNVAATTEAGARVTINALANAIDDDHGALLSVVNVPTVLPTGISYDAATHSFTLDPTNAVFQSLAQGQVGAYSVAYGVSDGMVTTATTATFNVTGVNNATVISGPALGTANEGGALANIDARVNATDIDTPIESLRVVNLPTILPAGVSFNAATQKFFLDPTNAAYRFLSVGETTTIVIPYSLTDGYAVVPTSAVFTVTGKNNAPTVTATVNGGTVLETAAPVTLKLLANASDVDHLDVLNVSLTPGSGVAATVSSGIWSAPIAFTIANNQLSLNPSQFANLALGKTVGITFNYQVTDGNPGGTIAASATLAVQGVYGGPTGVAIAPQTALLGKLLGGSGLNAKSVLANLVETGGIASNSYSYALSGTGAGAFTIGSSAGTAQLSTGTSGPIGAAGGQLYALGISTTDTSAGLSSAASPLDVVVGLGRGSNIINLASLPGMAAATPTFIFDLGGSDTVNGAGMTGKLWLDGGQGADTMTGGSGANTYLYSATADSTATAMDIITNFPAAADMLDFTGLGSKFTSVGALATSATSIAGGAIGWQTSGGNMFIYANTSGNSQALTAAAMKIEVLGTVGLTGNNFVHL